MNYRLVRRWHKTGRETRQAKTYTDFGAAAVAAQFMEAYFRQYGRPCSVRLETVSVSPEPVTVLHTAEPPQEPGQGIAYLSGSAANGTPARAS